MSVYGDNIAGEEEVKKRALENLKKDYGIELSEEEYEEVYGTTSKYIRHKLLTEPWCSVNLPNLGRAYYSIRYLRKQRRLSKYEYKRFGKEFYKERSENWDKKVKEVERVGRSYQYHVNVSNFFEFYHNRDSLLRKSKKFGYDIEKIEEIQNEIK